MGWELSPSSLPPRPIEQLPLPRSFPWCLHDCNDIAGFEVKLLVRGRVVVMHSLDYKMEDLIVSKVMMKLSK